VEADSGPPRLFLPRRKRRMLSLTMKDGIITATLALVGFAVPLGIAWHQGVFDDGNAQSAAAPRLLAHRPLGTPTPFRSPSTVEPMAPLPPESTAEASPQLDDTSPITDETESIDPLTAESRQTTRENRQH
jgi:hypothetical protein